MPLLPKVTKLGGALYSAGNAAVTAYKEQRLEQKLERTPGDNHAAMEATGEDTSSEEFLERKDPGQPRELYEILSSLIQGVYAADRGKANAAHFWESLGYEKEALEDESATEEEIAAVGKPTCKIRLMVFRQRDDFLLDRHTAIPKYVIAIRGTRKYCQRDILADLQILCETLHHNPLYDVVKAMTRRVVEKHSHDMVCVAGHSLGAAIGLIVTRELALEDLAVETHLFNPPFFSLETLLEKFSNLGAKGIEKLTKAFGSRDPSSRDPSSRDPSRRISKSKRDEKYRKEMAREFAKLGKWTPSLYLNPYDTICNGYIHYFRNQDVSRTGWDALAISLTAGPLRRLLSLDSQSYHLIPAAHLWINHRGGNVLKAHPLDQWHDHPTVELRHEKHDLLADSQNLLCNRDEVEGPVKPNSSSRGSVTLPVVH